MIILGLDISSSRIGYCLINENKDLLLVDEIKLKSSQSLEERADIFKNTMQVIKEHSEVDYVFIEQPFMAFSGGKTTAATMAKLQRFNGMCSHVVHDLFSRTATQLQANKARGLVGLKIKRGQKTKLKVIEWVSEKYPKDFIVEYTRHGNPKPGIDDKADAVVIALAGWETLQNNS
jgi:Holliday junction resolvasome RuvABC endonuclease subunit